jgi:hypothetical protein
VADRYELAKDEKPETPVAEEQKPREKIAVWPMDVRLHFIPSRSKWGVVIKIKDPIIGSGIGSFPVEKWIML